MKMQNMEWEKIFINHTSNKELVLKISKELLKFNYKIIIIIQLKLGKNVNRYFSRYDMQMAIRYPKRCPKSVVLNASQSSEILPHTY